MQSAFVSYYYENVPAFVTDRLRDVGTLFADTPTLEALDLSRVPLEFVQEAATSTIPNTAATPSSTPIQRRTSTTGAQVQQLGASGTSEQEHRLDRTYINDASDANKQAALKYLGQREMTLRGEAN